MRLIDANALVESILEERAKIPLTVPAAPYEIVKEKPYEHGNSMRGGIRKALRCVANAPTVNAVIVPDCKKCLYNEDISKWDFCEHCIGSTYRNNSFIPKEE